MADSQPSCLTLQYRPELYHYGRPNPPMITNLTQALANQVPAIATAVTNALDNLASNIADPAIFYLFNLAHQNDFRNDHWLDLVEHTVMEFLILKLRNPAGADTDALYTACNNILVTYAAFLACTNPIVLGNIHPENQQETIKFADRWRQEAAERVNMRKGRSGQMPNQGYATIMQSGPNSAAVSQMNIQIASPNSLTNGNVYAGAGNQFQRAVDANEVKPHAAPRNLLDRFAPLTPEKVNESQEAPPPVRLGSAKEIRTVKLTPSGPLEVKPEAAPTGSFNARTGVMTYNWKPSVRQFYKPATMRGQDRLVLQQMQGSPSHCVYVLSNIPEEEKMKQSDHEILSITSSMVRSFLPDDAESPRLTVQHDLAETAKALASISSQENINLTSSLQSKISDMIVVGADLLEFDSLQSAIANARLMAIRKPAGNKTFLSTVQISRTFNTRASQDEFINDYLNTITGLVSLADIMHKYVNDKKTTEAAQFIARLDLILTREINSVFRVSMGLSDFYVESFMIDYVDVAAVMERKYGKYYLDALTRYEPIFLEKLRFNDFTVMNIFQDPMSEEGEPVGYQYAIAPEVSICLIDEPADSFGVIIPENDTQEVFQHNLPGVHAFIEQIVKSSNSLHHYLVTSDDRVYEVGKSILGDALIIAGHPAL